MYLFHSEQSQLNLSFILKKHTLSKKVCFHVRMPYVAYILKLIDDIHNLFYLVKNKKSDCKFVSFQML